ncbi:LOW QUALITY PROTEIN: transmembrane protein 17B-like [Accipiter gentilis]|uniref:LOW QUALITY PROTEIN: transmembrane protein 17B-like n=1 Tax=Astur gentilis TaxID=8957 RepID=UPI0021108A5B|nr:LOW QUALITY PROTEIN: transmembrane protein 17B-like [Accipiter gentilis]
MAAHTPLPPNLRWGLAVFSSSLFINNKTWDSGAAHTYHPAAPPAWQGPSLSPPPAAGGVLGSPAHPCLPCLAHEVLASLPLQMMLYFNVYYFPVWCLAEGMMLQLKYHLLPWHYQFLLVTAFLILSLAEGSRLYLGYVGNLQEKVPELAGFLLLSFLIQLPLLLFLLTDSHIIRLPLEMAVHSLFLAFLVAEIVAAFLALKTMTKQLAAQFYLRQFKEGSRGRPGQGDTAGQVAEEG